MKASVKIREKSVQHNTAEREGGQAADLKIHSRSHGTVKYARAAVGDDLLPIRQGRRETV
jgi:hypothetical protein